VKKREPRGEEEEEEEDSYFIVEHFLGTGS
jgi:hypothetical protein